MIKIIVCYYLVQLRTTKFRMGIAKINDQRLCGTGGHAMSSMQVLLIMPMLLHITAAASTNTVNGIDDLLYKYYDGDDEENDNP
ncbi:unnamed protein product, partial [Nesidiocoris tenuis]